MSSTQAQQSFNYQAVARNSNGVPIANQSIGLQISVIQQDINNNPVYQEIHQVTSNPYGVVNLQVGNGTPVLGDFEKLDWSIKSFVQVEMDITGGTNYQLSGTSEILSVPKALYAETAGVLIGTEFGLYVTNFGAKGDATTDDTPSFITAIDSAAKTGAKVFIPAGNYKITSTLTIPDGVTLVGEGMGSTPLQTPYNGSSIRFEGSGYAIKITGHSAGLRDLVILDKSSNTAQGGVQIEADGRLVESLHFRNLLITGFTNGTGFQLYGKNNAGIAYCSFHDVRIRHAKIGIHIQEETGSFVNSNSFYHGAISGGGFDYGILIDGGNNNVFRSTVIEPPNSSNGHIVVNQGEIQGRGIRIEGNDQTATIPLIKFAAGTRNSILEGTYAGGLTLDEGNNFINLLSGKAIHYQNSNTNLFQNAVFNNFDGATLPKWQVQGSGVTIEVQSPALTSQHNVLKLTVPSGGIAYLKPTSDAIPTIKDLPLHDQINFGFHIKTTAPNVVSTVTNAPAGWTASQAYSGSGKWEFVGMNAFVNRNQQLDAKLMINNTTGSSLEVYISTPTFVFGNQMPTLDAPPITTAGGTIEGLLTTSMGTAAIPSNGFLELPQTANVFEITNTANIYRISHTALNRFPKGSTITLLFNNGGINVYNSGYLLLKGGFTSVANGSLTLISMGNGTWRELSRNN